LERDGDQIEVKPDLNTAFWQILDIERKIAKFEMAWHYTCSDVIVFPDFQASSNIQYTRGRFGTEIRQPKIADHHSEMVGKNM
jgi:hypothetical protein